jgi:ATP-dependent Lon protease
MVHTRNQKRKLEEDTFDDDVVRRQGTFDDDVVRRQGTFDDDVVRRQGNLEIDQNCGSNISISKKKKICKQENDNGKCNEDQITKDVDDDQLEDDFDIETESSYCSDTDEDIINTNLESLLKRSIVSLMKKCTNPAYKKEKKSNDPYDIFITYTNSIYEGDFFERESNENKKCKLKKLYTREEIEKINNELCKIKENYRENAPSIIEILKNNNDIKGKQKLLEKFYHYTNSDILTNDYTNNLSIIQKNTKRYDDPQLETLENEIVKKSSSLDFSDDYRERVLRSKMSLHNKILAYKRLDAMESFENTDTSEYAKYKSWMDILLTIPFDEPIVKEKGTFDDTRQGTFDDRQQGTFDDRQQGIKNIREILDKRLSFLEKPKDQIINIYTQMMRNNNFSINSIGLYGPKGIGKSSIIKSISEALDRPYRTISLGGESDSSLLTGHSFTYIGSIPGRIIEILRETKCTNPIILFDELDKVSESHQGKEIIGNLIHLTDATTNNKYNYDKYFAGLEFDLSKVLFVFTYNDPKKVDSILSDRLFKINIQNYSLKEKLEITRLHIIPNILEKYNFKDNTIILSDSAIDYIVEKNASDQGMRDINRKIETIISRINTLLLTDESDNIVKLKYKSLYSTFNKNIPLPVTILKEHVDILLSDSFTTDMDTLNEPPFGMYI